MRVLPTAMRSLLLLLLSARAQLNSALPAALTTSFSSAGLPASVVAVTAVAPPAVASAGFKAGALLAAVLAAAVAL
jgi:hypothetical protein